MPDLDPCAAGMSFLERTRPADLSDASGALRGRAASAPAHRTRGRARVPRPLRHAAQRRAVYLAYASDLFVDAVGPFQTLAAEIGGQLAGVAPRSSTSAPASCARCSWTRPSRGAASGARCSAPAVEGRAPASPAAGGCAARCRLNAAPFYQRAGFFRLRWRADAAAGTRGRRGARGLDGKVAGAPRAVTFRRRRASSVHAKRFVFGSLATPSGRSFRCRRVAPVGVAQGKTVGPPGWPGKK